jgi:DNA polymerase V
VEEGKSAPVNGILAVLGKEGEDLQALLDKEGGNAPEKKEDGKKEEPKKETQPSQSAPMKVVDTPKPAIKPAQPMPKEAPVPTDSKLKASPLARKLSSEKGIDLNEKLVKNKSSTFFLKISGEAMINAGIFNGDVLIVDRSIKAINGKIVVVVLNGEMLVRRFEKTFNRVRLIPETQRLSIIEVDPGSCEFSVWGVVTYAIHSV